MSSVNDESFRKIFLNAFFSFIIIYQVTPEMVDFISGRSNQKYFKYLVYWLVDLFVILVVILIPVNVPKKVIKYRFVLVL